MTGEAYQQDGQVDILIVDDHSENLLALQAVLSNPDYRLVTAHSGPEALKQILKYEFALILLDVMMPGMDGYEVASFIRKREKNKSVPIIFLTAVAKDTEHIFRGYSVGAVDYITKPFEPAVVRAKVSVFADLFRKTKQIKWQSALLLEKERLEKELSLREVTKAHERRIADLVTSIPGIVWEMETDDSPSGEWRMSFISQYAQAMLGYPIEKWMADPAFWLSVIHPDDRDHVIQAMSANMAQGSTGTCRYRSLKKDDQVIWIECHFLTMRQDGKTIGIRGVSLEITEQKRVEEALRESQERFDRVAQAARLGIWYCNLPSYELRWNDKLKEHFWLSGDAKVTMEIFHERLHLEDRDRVKKKMEASIHNHGSYDVEFRTIKPGDERKMKWIRAIGWTEYDKQGQPLHFDGITLDITLEKKIKEDLEWAVRSRDEFLSIISHELKTPITSLKLSTQLVKRNASKNDPKAYAPERMEKLVDQTERQASRLDRLIDDMLDVSRIQSGRFTLEREEVDFCELVKDVVVRLRPQLLSATGEPRLKMPGSVQGVWDRLRLEQVVTNLLTNAMRYGHGKPVEIQVEQKGDHVRLAVRDQGEGIPLEDQKRIFNRFERAISANEVSGLGLGLFISKEIVEDHGGKIWVESRLGHGSTFFVELPLDERKDMEASGKTKNGFRSGENQEERSIH